MIPGSGPRGRLFWPYQIRIDILVEYSAYMFLTGFFDSPHWNGVAAISSLLSLVTVFAAVVSWIRTRHRLTDGFLSFDSRSVGGSHLIRFQNIGEAECVIQMVFAKNMRVTSSDRLFPYGALPMGEEIHFGTSDAGKDSELVVLYTTSLDVRRVWVARFLPNVPPIGTFMLESPERMPSKAKREMVYERGESLFLNSGIGNRLRVIRLNPLGSDNPTLRRFVAGLVREGYAQIVPLGDACATARDDSPGFPLRIADRTFP